MYTFLSLTEFFNSKFVKLAMVVFFEPIFFFKSDKTFVLYT